MDKGKLEKLDDYVLENSLRESASLRALRIETANDPESIMQIPPIQGQFIGFIVN
ncbi:hypothetical protein [Algibacillus agarilyticus]|uniref:hypothetical protein n=1 Tax=Algibacillus agarilyticus TaxID=2234133 RepID=UPI0018E557A5|nr:hypothetical protein [Algibacillus agarilyticus]